MKTSVLFACWGVALALPSIARAEGDDAPALLRRGVELRREHRDAEALALFERALALSPTPSARAQLALCEQALGSWLAAERDLDAALAAPDDPWIARNAGPLHDARAVIAQHLAWLTVTVDVGGAVLRLDGITLPAASETRVVAGSRRLEAAAEGHAPERRMLALAPGEHARVDVVLTPLDARAVAGPARAPSTSPLGSATVVEPSVPADAGRSLLGPIALGAAGVASLGVATYFGVRTFQLKSDRDAACVGGCKPAAVGYDSDARSSAMVSNVAFGAGAALVAGGAVWWLLGRTAAPRSMGVEVAPLLGASPGLLIRGTL